MGAILYPLSLWAANGSSSLKADVDQGDRITDLHLTADQSLSGKHMLSASVKRAPWAMRQRHDG